MNPERLRAQMIEKRVHLKRAETHHKVKNGEIDPADRRFQIAALERQQSLVEGGIDLLKVIGNEDNKRAFSTPVNLGAATLPLYGSGRIVAEIYGRPSRNVSYDDAKWDDMRTITINYSFKPDETPLHEINYHSDHQYGKVLDRESLQDLGLNGAGFTLGDEESPWYQIEELQRNVAESLILINRAVRDPELNPELVPRFADIPMPEFATS